MNTPPLHDPTRPVFWHIIFADDHEVTSEQSTWDAISEQRLLDGVMLSWTKAPVRVLHASYRGKRYELQAPEPRPFFSFTRLGQMPGNFLPFWLYTLFGYEGDLFRHLLFVTPKEMYRSIEPRTDSALPSLLSLLPALPSPGELIHASKTTLRPVV